MTHPHTGDLEPVHRVVGLETELGILQPGSPYANPVALATEIVAAYSPLTRADLRDADGIPALPVRWDYEAEDPLADLRGGRVDRAAAHPSQLTDDPARPAPSGDAGPAPTQGDAPPQPPRPPWGRRPRLSAAEAALPRATSVVLTNGARLYVDHAHPEYSSPEVLAPRDALVWDRAGEVVARQAMDALADMSPDTQVVLYKNNVDGKGAAYGSHENYLVRRDLPFHTLATALIPFLVTRPLVAGAGRVGIGQRSETPGFQVSQRADYVEDVIGLQTTFNRPIVNTRDEPHADARYRRLHVINGDANCFDVPIYLKVATTNLLLWYLERAHERGQGLGDLAPLSLVGDAVEQHWALSHDTTLRTALSTVDGPATGLEIQRRILTVISEALDRDHPDGPGPETSTAVDLWRTVLDELQAYAAALGTPRETETTSIAARDVEWIAKKQLCDGLRARNGSSWDDPRLAALDIQWSDLRDGQGFAQRLAQAGRTRRLATDAEIEAAARTAPPGTRAAVRGRAVAQVPELVAASWTSLVLDVPGRSDLLRLELPGDAVSTPARTQELLTVLRGAAHPSHGTSSPLGDGPPAGGH